MSHFTVLVKVNQETFNSCNRSIEESIAKMLAPYQENNMGDCPAQFMEFNDCTKEINDGWVEADKSEYENIEDYVDSYFGYKWHPEHDAYGYYENPNAQWDWYTIGGRWSSMLPETTNNMLVDIVRVKNLDVQRLSDSTIEEMKKWWNNYLLYRQIKDGLLQEKDLPDEIKIDVTFFMHLNLSDMGLVVCVKPKEFIDGKWVGGEWNENIITSFEELVSDYKWFFDFGTWAVLDNNGWHEKGHMGWWGLSSATTEDKKQFAQSYFDTFIKDEDPDTYLVVVDCHI
jgi:hypothetical protein